jgi:hypothetical protein
MAKKRFLMGMAALLVLAATPAFAQSEADFTTDGKGTITKYEGFDTAIVIPATIGGKPVTAIGEGAFRKADLTGAVIPDSVKTIGSYAFSQNKLTSVTIGKGVTSIGSYAFSNNKLTAIVIPDSVQTIEGRAFENNPLEDITLGKGIISMSEFRERSLKRVTLAANAVVDVSGFGEKILYEYMCNDRKAGTYTRGADLREQNADGFKYIETEYGLAITSYTGDSNRLAIPEQINGKPVKYIGGTKRGLTGVRIPASVTGLGTAFAGCELTTVEIPNSVTYIGRSAFYGDSGNGNGGNKLTSVTIPDSVTYIGYSAFSNNQLTSVTIPNGVTYIGNSAFNYNKLTSVTIPNSVTYIGDSAFNYNKLTGVTIPNSVTYIGDSAFYGNKLTSVTIPDSVTYIGDRAFAYNPLTTVSISPVAGRKWWDGQSSFNGCSGVNPASRAALKAAGYTGGF